MQSFDVTGDQETICVGDIANLSVTLQNTNETDLQVTGITIGGANPTMFSFNDPNDANGFTLASQSTREVVIRYAPGLNKGTHTAEITVRTDAINEDSVKTATVEGTAVHYDRAISIDPEGNSTPIPIDQVVTRRVVLEPGEDMALANVTGFHFRLQYNGDFLKIDNNTGVKLGSDFANDFKIANYSNRQDDGQGNGVLLFDVVAKNNATINNTDGAVIAEINLGTYLPKKGSRVSDLILSTTVLQDQGVNNPCVDIPDAQGQIIIDSTCVFEIRKVVYIGGNTTLNAVKPNPVSGSEATIGFDIGATDCQTSIEIYNESNQLVETAIDKVMQPGRYEVKVPVSNWASGSYFIRMKAGNFEQVKKMIIVK